MSAVPFTPYEIPSQSFRDLSLEKQIEFGINDWVCEDDAGRLFYGRTSLEASDAARNYSRLHCDRSGAYAETCQNV